MLREMLDQCCHFEFDQRGRVIDAVPRKACDCSEIAPQIETLTHLFPHAGGGLS